MNASILPETASYAAAVRTALADLPAEEVEDLTEGLEADLAESWLESNGKPLIDPAAYAQELRLAADLPDAVPAAGKLARLQSSISSSLRGSAASIRKNPAGAATLDFMASLQPAWWVLRGYLAFYLVMQMFGSRGQLIPTNIFAVALAVVMIVGSVWVGTRNWGSFMRVLVFAGNLLAVFVLFFAIDAVTAATSAQNDSYDWGEETSDMTGVYLNGKEVTNLFAYDANGALISQVQLFDQDGKPVITSVDGGSGCLEWVQSPETADYDNGCLTQGVWLPRQLETGAKAWNIFPMLMAEMSDSDNLKPKDGAVPVEAKPPFVKVPAVGSTENSAADPDAEPAPGEPKDDEPKKN